MRVPPKKPRPPKPPLPPVLGDAVDILWHDENIFYRGVLSRQNQVLPYTYLIFYDDGDREILDLNEETWRYARPNRIKSRATFAPGDIEKHWPHGRPSIASENPTLVAARISRGRKRGMRDDVGDESDVPSAGRKKKVSKKLVVLRRKTEAAVSQSEGPNQDSAQVNTPSTAASASKREGDSRAGGTSTGRPAPKRKKKAAPPASKTPSRNGRKLSKMLPAHADIILNQPDTDVPLREPACRLPKKEKSNPLAGIAKKIALKKTKTISNEKIGSARMCMKGLPTNADIILNRHDTDVTLRGNMSQVGKKTSKARECRTEGVATMSKTMDVDNVMTDTVGMGGNEGVVGNGVGGKRQYGRGKTMKARTAASVDDGQTEKTRSVAVSKSRKLRRPKPQIVKQDGNVKMLRALVDVVAAERSRVTFRAEKAK